MLSKIIQILSSSLDEVLKINNTEKKRKEEEKKEKLFTLGRWKQRNKS